MVGERRRLLRYMDGEKKMLRYIDGERRRLLRYMDEERKAAKVYGWEKKGC